MDGIFAPTHLLIVLVIALLVFGPKRLPELGRSLGKAIREFRQATSGLREELGQDANVDGRKDLKTDLTPPAGETATVASQAKVENTPGGNDEVLTGEVVTDEPERPADSSTG